MEKYCRINTIFATLILIGATITSALAFNLTSRDASAANPPVGSIIYDNQQVPYVYYGPEIGYKRYAITTAFTLMWRHDQYLQTGNTTYLQYMKNNANWLVANAIPKHDNVTNTDYLSYENDFNWDYGMSNSWRSGMAQGLAVQALTKALKITGNLTYEDTIKSLLKSFYVEVKDGGMTYKTADKGWWYEEYAKETGQNPHILNGMMYAVLGLYEYSQFRPANSDAKFLYDQGVLALKEQLPNYDVGDGKSWYEGIHRFYAPPSYHEVHIDLLNQLYKITPYPVFKTFHDKWEIYRQLNYSTKKPILAWNFENGRYMDDTGKIAIGSVAVKNVTLVHNAKLGYGLEAINNGTGKGYIEIKDQSILNLDVPFTIVTQIKLPNSVTTGKLHPIIYKSQDEQHGFKLAWDNRSGSNIIWFGIGDGHPGHYHTVWAKTSWKPSSVHQVAVSFDGVQVKVFFDGILWVVGTPMGLSSHVANDSQSLWIGGYWYRQHYSEMPYIDNILIYPYDLSISEVKQLYNLSK